MSTQHYIYDGSARHPIKGWTNGVVVEHEAQQQLRNIANLPFIHKHVAVMPDVHFGKGATVGSVIPTRKAIVPAAVGVDIGCGMCAVRTSLSAADLPESMRAVRAEIEHAIPHGGPGVKGSWKEAGRYGTPNSVARLWRDRFEQPYKALLDKHRHASSKATADQLGTLGGGNHFIEVCLDEDDRVWVMLHSGSRGLGNRIGSYFIDQAKELMAQMHIELPDRDLAYLPEGVPLFADYWSALQLAQDFARASRDVMLDRTLEALRKHLPPFVLTEQAINCHHNYVALENHYGENVYVTRKGAVRARENDLGIIPGSMGTGSFIVRGKGNPESFCSCSHGAGRAMSRGAAKRAISLEDHAKAMTGIEARLDAGVLDESPAAYKDINAVMAAQSDLIEVVYRLRQIVNVKG